MKIKINPALDSEPRICTNCGKPMREGYVIDDGWEYFCGDECLYAWYSEEEYDVLCQQDAAYWTEWEEVGGLNDTNENQD